MLFVCYVNLLDSPGNKLSICLAQNVQSSECEALENFMKKINVIFKMILFLFSFLLVQTNTL